MHVILKKRMPGDIDFGLVYGVLALLALAAARYLPLQDILPSCPFKGVTGVPCPTCGATRSLAYLAQGDLVRSSSMNPAVPLAATILLLLFLSGVMASLFRRTIALSFTPREELLCRVGAAAAFLANWTYLVFNR